MAEEASGVPVSGKNWIAQANGVTVVLYEALSVTEDVLGIATVDEGDVNEGEKKEQEAVGSAARLSRQLESLYWLASEVAKNVCAINNAIGN